MIEKEISDMIKGQDKADLYIAIINALSKQIPRKPKEDGWLYCPCCGRDVLTDRFTYCPNCGQKIDWDSEVV